MESIKKVKKYIMTSGEFSAIFLRQLIFIGMIYIAIAFVAGEIFNPFLAIPNPDGVDIAKGIRFFVLVITFMVSFMFPSLIDN